MLNPGAVSTPAINPHRLRKIAEKLNIGGGQRSRGHYVRSSVMTDDFTINGQLNSVRGLSITGLDFGELQRPIRKDLDFLSICETYTWVISCPISRTKHSNGYLIQMRCSGSTDINAQFGVSWFALETAINTYSDLETGHNIFDSDTDLNYPPNLTRFLNFLGDTVLAANCLSPA